MASKERLIGANALIKEVESRIYWGQNNTNSILEAIYEAPTVDAAPVVHAHWEEWWPPKHMILTGEEMLYVCSACTAKYSDIENKRYCPWCGAIMDEERKDNG